VPDRLDCARSPGAAVVLDLDQGVVAWADLHPDGEGASRQAGAAVDGGISPELGGAMFGQCVRFTCKDEASAEAYDPTPGL
jgi:hypothetical protein